ncbi:30S ribosomal protein S3 [Candidatus Micrarchaeota archaeon]|nr:30S ribosomal protein S3 [Candidatus Micrarchaeota archaeon]
MTIERKFIQDSIAKYKVSKFLEKELDKSGFSGVNIQRTPIVTRIEVEVTRPGKVIGKKGKNISKITETIKEEFGMDNPQIAVIETPYPILNPILVAKRACRYIEMGKKVKPILNGLLKEIMSSGAMGAEIVASGKLAGKGGRARSFRVLAGYIPKSGEPTRLVRKAHYAAYPKAGAIGIYVRIVPPGTKFPDKEIGQKIEIPKIISKAEEIEQVKKRGDEETDETKKRSAPPRRKAPIKRGRK